MMTKAKSPRLPRHRYPVVLGVRVTRAQRDALRALAASRNERLAETLRHLVARALATTGGTDGPNP